MSAFASDFDILNLAVQSIAPNNKVLFDDKGLPSVMVWVPKMTYAELGLGNSNDVFPAFVINGSEVPGIWVSKYQNVVYNSRAYSLPARDPKTSISFDNALTYCKNKGAGWHLMTRMEWMAIALWCKKHDCMPLGNNNYGKDVSEDEHVAIKATSSSDAGHVGDTAHVLTGTGPLTWSHDGTLGGIWDLNGNVWEWVGGIRAVYGELQVLVTNNAADNTKSQAANSSEWKAISAADGSFITPDGTGTTSNAIRARWKSSHWEWGIETTSDGTTDGKSCTLESVTCSADISDAAKLILQALGMFKYDTEAGAYNGDYLYLNSHEAERSFGCGGCWSHGARAGVFCAYGGARSGAAASFGFRSAYCELPSA